MKLTKAIKERIDKYFKTKTPEEILTIYGELITSKQDKLVDEIYWLELQNLSGREDFQEAFRLGIQAAVEHLTELNDEL